jgi:hypothetical protein
MPDFGILRGFNEKLFGDKLFAGQLPINLGNNFDPDAQAFFDRVTAAGGTLSATEELAVDTLVKQMKLDGIWTAMKAIYPMVGASAAACAQNLKSASFTGSFSSGWTFASTGVTPNGTSAFLNTNYLVNSTNGYSHSNMHLSHYSRTNSATGAQVDMGAGIATPAPANFNNFYHLITPNIGGTMGNLQLNTSTANSLGFAIKSATSSTSLKLYKNNSLLQTITTAQTSSSNIGVNMTIAAQNQSLLGVATPINFSSRQCAFSSIGDGLTDTQASNFYTAVQAFQTTLSRNI